MKPAMKMLCDFVMRFILVASLVQRSTTGLCLSLWYPVGYNCYRVFEESLNWMDSLQVCKEHGASLATINDEAENTLVGGGLCSGSGNNNLWIGFNDIEHEGVWQWTTNSEEDSNFQNWASHQPNNFNGAAFDKYNADCATIKCSNSHFWNDRNCVDIYYSFVCEKERQQHIIASKTVYGEKGSTCLKESELMHSTVQLFVVA
ncbi:C-type lectin-like [Antedon mediterranea]|uniref:C-type lectin-like n=1 Tax=Antedon mediterranea TaxID=105859 RepID=UPI003AF5269B